MLNNAWGKPDADVGDQDFKKDVGQFFDKLICKQKSRLDTGKTPESISPDDLLTLAGDDCKDLISASRKICHNLSRIAAPGSAKLVKKMDILPSW
ncbi:hypothetical protein QYE76_037654 [Lolium multiflorum]|uniref:Uncharacterized protein n=1 Tax=Lolium multiflorum TaxID=4521 RepID=A0AAD8UXY6_LOLMU|nr:hypothetical protein QYE76_037654 [Lolium multiflorum]